ncbi:hypothetical protein [Salipiger mucosus]|uniref:Uncharacterized protein n=1 Tax=Salipiger mucosus DSM 16094 TaxID=1123237 RepID=S9RZH5_9RHOB|nr:hypothetical protein [Salipiger mucosus]EPX83415.1 hypothetical protein Salmuc_02023 [Salipiger mucosus DSM 16094]
MDSLNDEQQHKPITMDSLTEEQRKGVHNPFEEAWELSQQMREEDEEKEKQKAREAEEPPADKYGENDDDASAPEHAPGTFRLDGSQEISDPDQPSPSAGQGQQMMAPQRSSGTIGDALAGVIIGTGTLVGNTAKAGVKGTVKGVQGAAKGVEYTGKGANYAVSGFQDRMRKKQQEQFTRHINALENTEERLVKKVDAHNQSYEPFAQRVRELEASDTFRQRFTDEKERREKAMSRAFDDMPEFATDKAMDGYQKSWNDIETLANDHMSALHASQGFEKALQVAPEDAQERFKNAMTRSTDVNGALDKVSQAATMSDDDETIRERIKESVERIREAIMNFINKFLPGSMSLGR